MRKYSILAVLAVVLTVIHAPCVRAAEEPAVPIVAEAALKRLFDGNERYTKGLPTAFKKADTAARQSLSHWQKPSAVILTCMDSRVPPEIIFDQTLGDIFAVRVAGNVLDPLTIGSIEFVVQHFDTPLVVVLGHERCGALTAAIENSTKPAGHSGVILKALEPAVNRARKEVAGKDKAALIEIAIDENIKLVTAALREQPFLAGRIKESKLLIIGAKYDLDDGKVTIMVPEK